MTLKTRLARIEGSNLPSGAMQPNAIIVCALTAYPDQPSTPGFAYLVKKGFNDQMPALPGETLAEFQVRLDAVLATEAEGSS